MTATLTESRSGQSLENLQEILDAGQQGDTSLEQYLTAPGLAAELASYLPSRNPASVFDPQAGDGALLNCIHGWPSRFGIELDHTKSPGAVNLITANCMKVFEAVEELMPELRFVMANANPPFGKKWKTKTGAFIDSTLATWQFVTRHANCGFFIGNANTVEKLCRPDASIDIIRQERRPASKYWKGLRSSLEIGIVCWKRKDFASAKCTYPQEIGLFWNQLRAIFEEEKLSRPPFNIYLTRQGFLKTYLSQRNTFKLKLKPEQIKRLHSLNDVHPLTLTTEKETRVLLRNLVDCGLYTLQPEARQAIESALAEVNAIACPIMNISEFEHVAYTEEEDSLMCHASIDEEINGQPVALTAGKSYPLRTGTYKFTQAYRRNKVHYNEEHKETYTQSHQCVLSGSDRYIEIKDDCGRVLRFMDRPRKENPGELPESTLWHYFDKPAVQTVAEVCREQVAANLAVLKACEMLAGYAYYPGQINYLARVAAKDCALIAAAVGTGKSLFAISMLAMKSPNRAVIIAPQGTMRASAIEEDDDEEDVSASMSASQWIKELNKFAPYLQVWELFSYEDYLRILSLNNGKLPFGVYVTYYEAFFSNGAMEKAPATWDDDKLNAWATANGFAPLPEHNDAGSRDKHHWCDSVGHEVEGVRCIIQPCLSTLIGNQFDCVLIDEAHKCKGLSANLTQMLIRLQPRYRYAMTATPVSNIVSDLFPLLGWLAVPEWYKGNRRNAAWPYARQDLGRFNSTFLTQERDLTQEDHNRQKDPKWRGRCIKESPIISSPARLLKLLKPNMAFIDKPECRAEYIPPKIIDVRVPMGKEQARLYGHFTNRANITAKSAYIRAGKQTTYLRNICADPAGFSYGGPKVLSNMNPKVIAILELTRDILGRGEQVVIINSRVGITSTLATKLTEAGIPIARIDSTTQAEQHAYQANLFKAGKARVCFMGIKSAAAYSFDACENLIIGSLEYSFGTFAQACGRIDRVVNQVVKHIYVILHKNSIEEIMFDVCALKGDASALCLRGKRIPREFKPVDSGEILAQALDRFDLSGAKPESECEREWPRLRTALSQAMKQVSTATPRFQPTV
jgi:predicted RNA methylase